MTAQELDDKILSILTDDWMTITRIQRLIKESSGEVNNDLISLWCGMLIGEKKVDALKVYAPNSYFYVIRRKQDA